MDSAEVGRAGYIRYWHPLTREEIGRSISSVDDVAMIAEFAANEYREAGAAALPGLALWRGPDIPEDSLTLGVSREGWAVIFADAEFSQRITRRSDRKTDLRERIQLDDDIEISDACFIDRDLALEAISYWFATGEALDACPFTGS